MTDQTTEEKTADFDETPELKLRVGEKVYPFPSFDTLSYIEARRIKKETGLVMGKFFAALEDGDTDALLAVAQIAMTRDNPRFKVDSLYNLHLNDIEIIAPETEPEEQDDSPLDESSAVSLPSSETVKNDD